MLQIYNSLNRKKEKFVPIEPGKVRMYVCGITTYDFCHVGHARMFVVFDMVVRFLRHVGFDVTYVRNITDVDDKIIRRANELDEPISALTARFIDAMHEDETSLNVLPPDVEPRATGAMDVMVNMIEQLINTGYAYLGSSGDVYYDVSKFEAYGHLSNKNIDDLRAGARVEIEQAKDDPLDFVLWKMSKTGEPGWPSPWGEGRPGWHIECSAMARTALGEHFDIHGGGMDLKFPHHENEIAQSEACSGQKMVNYWMHNGFVQTDDEKMSKSLGNFFTVRDVLTHHAPEVIRYFILATHYRSPLGYSEANLENARASLSRMYTALRGLPESGEAVNLGYRERFNACMDDDFNSAGAMAVLFELAREINRLRESDSAQAAAIGAELRSLGGVLGLLGDDPETFLQSGTGESGLSDEEVENLIAQRVQARATRDFGESDRLRDLLTGQGIVLEDSAQGTSWRRK